MTIKELKDGQRIKIDQKWIVRNGDRFYVYKEACNEGGDGDKVTIEMRHGTLKVYGYTKTTLISDLDLSMNPDYLEVSVE